MIQFFGKIFTKQKIFRVPVSIKINSYNADQLDLAIGSSLQTKFPEITSIMTGFSSIAFENYPDFKGEMIDNNPPRYKLSDEIRISQIDFEVVFKQWCICIYSKYL